MQNTYDPVEAKNRLQLTWQKIAAITFAGLLLFIPLAYFHAMQLWRPIMFAAIGVSLTTVARWDLHDQPWFWLVVSGFVAVHVMLIALIPWNTHWLPAVFIGPIVVGDVVSMLALFQLAEKLTPDEPSSTAPHSPTV